MFTELMDALRPINDWCEDFERPGIRADQNLTLRLVEEELQETKDSIRICDKEEVVDGFADIAFLAINGIYKEYRRHGFTPSQARERTACTLGRVVQANNAKRGEAGAVRFREDGKILKPEGWTPPSHKDLFE